MPIYEYLCSQCRESFSLLRKMGAGEEQTICPKCGSSEVTRQISACAVGSSGSQPAGPSCGIGGG
jgi:putative FmdB family regulatory protein